MASLFWANDAGKGEDEMVKQDAVNAGVKCSQADYQRLSNEKDARCHDGSARSCSIQTDDCASATAKVAAGYACIDARTNFQKNCFSPGGSGYEGHMQQIAQEYALLRNCIEVMHEKCGDR